MRTRRPRRPLLAAAPDHHPFPLRSLIRKDAPRFLVIHTHNFLKEARGTNPQQVIKEPACSKAAASLNM